MQSKTIKRLLSPFEQFVHSESIGGLALIAASLFAWTSSPWVPGYFTLGEMSPSTGSEDRRFEEPLLMWRNDELVAFLPLVGTEMKREVFVNSLSALRVTVLAAALGLLGRRASPGVG